MLESFWRDTEAFGNQYWSRVLRGKKIKSTIRKSVMDWNLARCTELQVQYSSVANTLCKRKLETNLDRGQRRIKREKLPRPQRVVGLPPPSLPLLHILLQLPLVLPHFLWLEPPPPPPPPHLLLEQLLGGERASWDTFPALRLWQEPGGLSEWLGVPKPCGGRKVISSSLHRCVRATGIFAEQLHLL